MGDGEAPPEGRLHFPIHARWSVAVLRAASVLLCLASVAAPSLAAPAPLPRRDRGAQQPPRPVRECQARLRASGVVWRLRQGPSGPEVDYFVSRPGGGRMGA